MVLETLYNLVNKAYPLKLIAGENGIKRQMTWFHILEDSSHSSYIRGNELVFTTGIACQGEKWLIDFISKLNEHKACGLVINIGPHIAGIPAQVLDLCNQFDLPLFTVPWSVQLVDLTRYLSQLIIDSERKLYQTTSALKYAIISPESGDYKAQLLDAGYRLDASFFVAQISAGAIPDSDGAVGFIQHFLLLQGDNGVTFCLDSSITVIYISVDISQIKAAIEALHAALSQGFPQLEFHIGVSEAVQGIDNLSKGYRQAGWVMRVAGIEARPFLFFNETGIYRILYPVNDKQVLKDYAEDILGEIRRYDESHKTDYLRWLRLYVCCDGSVQRIAEEAFCHRNTVNYKLKRIRELFKLDTDSNLQKANILIALHIFDLSRLSQDKT